MKRLLNIQASSYTNKNRYDEQTTLSRGGKRFSVKYNSVDTSPNADPMKMLRTFKAQVSEIHPYDEAEYVWARIGQRPGIIEYIQNGSIVDVSYYMTSEDWDVENIEWCDTVIDTAIENLIELNKNVQPRMSHY